MGVRPWGRCTRHGGFVPAGARFVPRSPIRPCLRPIRHFVVPRRLTTRGCLVKCPVVVASSLTRMRAPKEFRS
jgi:hypothetical protein